MFNRAATVARAIASVLAQTIADWELIVVDDGSEEALAPSLATFADERVRVLRHDRNRGAAAARNTGIEAARAPLVAFIDSDDEWLPRKLERQLAVMERVPASLGALCTAFRLRRTRTGYAEDRYPRARGTWAATLLDGCFVSPGSTLLARRECFEAIGFFDEALGRFEDWDWLLRLVEHYAFDCVPEVLAVVHVGDAPRTATVATAASTLEMRQSARIRAMAGERGLRHFRASLALERANAAMLAGNSAAATAAIAEAMVLSPGRVLRFLGRGFGRLRAADV